MVDGSHMSAAECRERAESAQLDAEAAIRLATRVGLADVKELCNRTAKRALERAAEWRAAAEEAEQREARDHG